jgi:hypothetical protein
MQFNFYFVSFNEDFRFQHSDGVVYKKGCGRNFKESVGVIETVTNKPPSGLHIFDPISEFGTSPMRRTNASCLTAACFSLNSSSVKFVMFLACFSHKNSEAVSIKLQGLRCARNVSGGI